MTWSRIPAGVAAAVVLALALAGCGGASPEAGASGGAGRETADADPLAGAPRTGECRNATAKQAEGLTLEAAPVVDCAETHTLLAVIARELPETFDLASASDDLEALEDYTTEFCSPVMKVALGGTRQQQRNSLFRQFFFLPSERQQAEGARWIACYTGMFATAGLLPLPDRTPFLESTTAAQDLLEGSPFASCTRVQGRRSTLVPCDGRHVARATRHVELPGDTTPDKNWVGYCEKRYPTTRWVGALEPRPAVSEPGKDVLLVACLEYDLLNGKPG